MCLAVYAQSSMSGEFNFDLKVVTLKSTFCEDKRLISIVDEIEISEKSENRKHEYKLKSFQQNLARFEIKNGASGKCWKLLENDRIELENELITCKSQIDQLKTDNQRLEDQSKGKQAKLDKYEKEINALMKC